MIDTKEFLRIRKEFTRFEAQREQVIQISRSMIHLSKQIIYALQRNDTNRAKKLTDNIKKFLKQLPDKPYDANIQKVAKQEYVEALCFYEFVVHNKIPNAEQLGVEYEEYLLGLCDLTGELVRKAVIDVINKRIDEARKTRNLVEELYGEFLKLDLRNSELRKKADSIKWNLRRLDDLMYDVSMKGG